MVENYDYKDSSDSDSDELLRHEIESLSQACKPPVSQVVDDGDDDDEDGIDDLEFVRSITDRYGVEIPNSDDIKPLSTLPPSICDDDEDDDDDYELYLAIKERFSEQKESVNEYRDHIDEKPDDYFDSESTTFPVSAQVFIEAIKKNRQCQKFIRSKLLHIEAKMDELKKIRRRVKTVRDFNVQCKRNIGRALSQKQDVCVQLISYHKHWSNDNIKAVLEKFPIYFHRDKWTESDKQNLRKGIVRQYQEKLMHNSEIGLSNSVDDVMLSIKNHNVSPECIQRFSQEVNWEQLAAVYLPRRSGEECETRWLNHENCLINFGNWTGEEEKKLLSLVSKNGVNCWKTVAEELGTNRTRFQCLVHYQGSFNVNFLKRDWTEDEDILLRSAVESFGESNWQAVASMLVGRTGPQCSNRWMKTLHPARKKVGRWDNDEDKRLKVAVALFGKSWYKIARFVPGRTQSQCRERWVNVLDPCLNQGEWTEEEDTKLKDAISEHGCCWSRIAACVPMRTDNHCRRRWERLYPHDVPRLKASKKMQKVALISNFVDREAYRPTLGPNDFASFPVEGSTNEPENGNGSQKRKRRKPRKCEEVDLTETLSSMCNRLKRKKRK